MASPSREREVATLLARGLSSAEIAETLVLSPYTVQDHVKSLYEKLGVGSRQELVARVFLDEYLPEVVVQTPITSKGRFEEGWPQRPASPGSCPEDAGDQLVGVPVRGLWDPLEDHSADLHPPVGDLGLERKQTGAADVPVPIDVRDQQARIRTGGYPGQAELVGAGEACQQRPVLGLGGRPPADRLGMLDEPDPRLVIDHIADGRRSRSSPGAAVDMYDGESRRRRALRTSGFGIGLREGSALGVGCRASLAALSARPALLLLG